MVGPVRGSAWLLRITPLVGTNPFPPVMDDLPNRPPTGGPTPRRARRRRRRHRRCERRGAQRIVDEAPRYDRVRRQALRCKRCLVHSKLHGHKLYPRRLVNDRRVLVALKGSRLEMERRVEGQRRGAGMRAGDGVSERGRMHGIGERLCREGRDLKCNSGGKRVAREAITVLLSCDRPVA